MVTGKLLTLYILTSVYILHTVLYKFLMVLTRRICLRIVTLMGDSWVIIINPLTLTSDQDRISPYNIDTISSRKVMRIKKNIS